MSETADATATRVRVDIEDGVADVRLARADKLNALDQEMFDAVIRTGCELGANPRVRVVVLSGEGRAFSAGLDFASFQRMRGSQADGAPDLVDRDGESPANRAQMAAWVWRDLPVPVIAAVHGVAFGGGLQIALGADMRIVSPDVRLSVREVHWGLIPDMAGTQLMRDLVRLDIAKELTYTAREVNGEEAQRIGLATKVADDPLGEAMTIARCIASRSPDAIRASKQLLNASRELDVASGLQLESQLQVSLIGAPNQVEAVLANMEKRPAAFRDPS